MSDLTLKFIFEIELMLKLLFEAETVLQIEKIATDLEFPVSLFVKFLSLISQLVILFV